MKRLTIKLTPKQVHIVTIAIFEYIQICNEVSTDEKHPVKNAGYYIARDLKKIMDSIDKQVTPKSGDVK